jgi:glycerol-3-phosphate dehydrogenase
VEIALAPNKGTLVAMGRRPVTHVLNHCRPPADGDIIVPNGTGVVLGTTAVPTADPDDDAVPDGEPARLLEEAIRMVPVLREVEMARSWAAVRPLALAEGPQLARAADPAGRATGRDYLLVDHEERDGLGGLITVIGGKVTTARRMAQAASDLVCDKLGIVEPCRTADEALPGAAGAQH